MINVDSNIKKDKKIINKLFSRVCYFKDLSRKAKGRLLSIAKFFIRIKTV